MGLLLYFIISLLASIVGAICGIGGGAIIKPILDFFALDSVATISFLSGCTVLTMSLYSVGSNAIKKEQTLDFKFCTPIAIGAALGGVLGKVLFDTIIELSGNQVFVGQAQSVCMIVITAGTFIYTIFKNKIKSLHVKNMFARILIGLALGVVSSFLGIGGGPIKLVTFFFFFSMDAKTAAQNSLYTILVSQLASLATSLINSTVPMFNIFALILMVIGGASGGMIGRKCVRKMSNRSIEKVFLSVMALIIVICIFNTVR